MSHITRKLLLAGLSLVLFGGTISPVLAQADSAETANTAAEDTSSSVPTTYKLSSIGMPYTEYRTGTQTQKKYWFDWLNKNAYTPDEILGNDEGDTWWTNNLSHHDSDTVSTIGNANFAINTFAAGISLNSPTETLGEFTFDYQQKVVTSPSTSYSSDKYSSGVYLFSWLLKLDAQIKLGTTNFEKAKADYYNNHVDEQSAKFFGQTSDPLAIGFTDKDSFDKYILSEAGVAPIAFAVDNSAPDFAKQFSNLNPSATAEAATKLASEKMVDLFNSGDLANILVADSAALTPILVFDKSSSTPAPSSPAPTSQPVTVHYVDDQGTTLKPDKTLTGSLGDTYKAEPLTITGYTLAKTTGTESGTFSDTAQAVTYTYAKNAVKATVLSATKKIGLYNSPDFSRKTLKQWYAKKSQLNRPMFEVIGTAISKTGAKRYQVTDVNSGSDTFGQTGYITANTDYTTSAYYTPTYKQITVISPNGVDAYGQKSLTHQKTHYKQGQVLKIKEVVTQNMTTRFLLTNGTYITANKKLVTAGKLTMPKRVQAKTALNRYGTANLTKRNHHYTKKAHVTFRVKGWAYSNANDFSKGDTLRYKVAGGYITANKHLVRTID